MKAPRDKVWRALTTPSQFAQWFHVQLDGEFVPGAQISLTSTHPGHEGVRFSMVIDRMEAEKLFSWKWVPGAPEDGVTDYSNEPTTTVTFRLQDDSGGTLITVEENGFDALSLTRRAKVLEENAEGWGIQLQSLAGYVDAQ